MDNATNREEYIAAWKAHINELVVLAFQAKAEAGTKRQVFDILNQWIENSADATFVEKEIAK